MNVVNHNEARKYKTANGAIHDILQTVSKCFSVFKYLNVYTVYEQIKLHLCPHEKYGFPCTAFQKTHKCSKAFCAALLYHISSKRTINLGI